MATPADPSPDAEWLSAAECAARTGLTVRALRVYERAGLINPPRSANGWRRYGAAELARLNSIVVLKALGLTLTQIRDVLADHPPSLLHILGIHATEWQAKREAAERALVLVAAARARLQAHDALSVHELCDLIKGLETNRSATMKSQTVVMRDLINQHTTAEEERAWNTWWAEHPQDVEENRAFVAGLQLLFAEVERVAASGADAASPEMQHLLVQHNELLLRFKVRERAVRQLAWNRPVTLKFWSVGARSRAAGEPTPLARHGESFQAAMKGSPWGEALGTLLEDVRTLTESGADPASAAASDAVDRLREICRDHKLGDAYLCTQWSPFIARINRPDLAPGIFDAAWEFLARALAYRPAPEA